MYLGSTNFFKYILCVTLELEMSLIKPLMGFKAFIKGFGLKVTTTPTYQGNKIKTKTCLDYGISKYTSTKSVPQPTVTPLGESHIIETLLASFRF